MNITTVYKTNSKGAGQIVAKAAIKGKGRQKTTNYDHSLSNDRNHGEAAANLLLSNALDAITGGLSRDAVLNATHDSNEAGTVHSFFLGVN